MGTVGEMGRAFGGAESGFLTADFLDGGLSGTDIVGLYPCAGFF
jgi:hypothetical protein